MQFRDENNEVWYFNTLEEKEQHYKGQGGELTLITDEEAEYIKNPPLTPEQQLTKMQQDATALIDGMIQQVIDDYNTAHGVAFKNVDSLTKYTKKVSYTHYQFCSDVLDWVTDETGIWETARAIQQEVIEGTREIPTEQEFIALLPAYSGVV